jgi:PAS domain S-box-containing protein
MNEELKSQIADHKRVGEVLREQAGLLDLTHDSVFVRDMKDVITYWNRGAEKLYGWTREEAVGKVCHQLTQTIFPAQLREITRELLRTGRWDGELVHMKRDGTQVVVASRWALQRDEQGQPVAILETNNDITERKWIEETLHERESHLTQILRSVPLVLYRAYPAESFGALWISDNVELVTGFPVRQFIENSQFWASRLHPKDRERVLVEFGAIDQKDGLTTEYRWQCGDGTYRWFLDQAGITRDTEGQLTAILGTWQDITERKQAEEALRQLSSRLLQLQDEERRHIARELHDSTAQTLAALSMNLTAVDRVANALSEEARKALTESLALARHASRELRTLSYLLHPPMLDESGLASALGWYVDGFVQRSGIEVELDISPQLGRLPSDVEMTLFRIVQECLTNVLKHSQSQTANVEIVLSPAQVTLEVSDQGKGMPTKVLRGSGDVVSGLGVGISGMFERVRQLRGSMNITSGDRGTSVRVSLPLAGYEA